MGRLNHFYSETLALQEEIDHTDAMKGVAVFFPVYNEEALLAHAVKATLNELTRIGLPFEVLLGSNGSTDQTPRLGKELEREHKNVRFFHHSRRGPGAAFRQAVEWMRYDVLVSLDIDLAVPTEFVARAVQALQTHDLVIGSKKLGIENRSGIRRWGSDVFNGLSKSLLGLPFDDYSIGAKAYRRSLLEKYFPVIGQGTSYVQRIVFQAHRDGFKICQIPVLCTDTRRSRFNLLWEGMYRFGCLFGLWIQRLKSSIRACWA